jgi:hypothetical protein
MLALNSNLAILGENFPSQPKSSNKFVIFRKYRWEENERFSRVVPQEFERYFQNLLKPYPISEEYDCI